MAFGGTAGQVESAFGVEIHHYLSGGEVHYANAGDPTVPAAFQGVARAIHGLNDFTPESQATAACHAAAR